MVEDLVENEGWLDKAAEDFGKATAILRPESAEGIVVAAVGGYCYLLFRNNLCSSCEDKG